MRWLPAFPALLLGLAPALGQQPPSIAAQGAPADTADYRTIKLTIRPAAAPVPALKYHFLPTLREQKRGNAVFLYYRAFSPEWLTNLLSPAVTKAVDAWQENPRQVPGPNLRWVLTAGALKEIDRGARRSYADWELTDRLRQEGIGLLLPDMQGFRRFGTWLALRARLEIADGRLDKAAYTFQTSFAFSRHVSQGPTLIQALVGAAMTNVTLDQVDEFIQTPKAPNLYWALTNLPTPFIDLRRGYQGEAIMIDTYFPGVREMLAAHPVRPMSRGEVRAWMDRIFKALREMQYTDRIAGPEGRASLALLVAEAYPEARRFLLSQGRSAQEVDALPMFQAVAMLEVYNYDRLYDEMVKWGSFPYWKAKPGMDRAVDQLKRAKAAGPQTGTTLAVMLLPATEKVLFAAARTDRRIAALRCVEAVRLYAASHEGKLPARLDDIKAVPVPTDPVTGRPFQYTANGNRAVLTAGPPTGEKANQGNALRYELTLQP